MLCGLRNVYLLQSHPSQSHSILHLPSSQQQAPISTQWHLSPSQQQEESSEEHPVREKHIPKISKVSIFFIYPSLNKVLNIYASNIDKLL
jgi:hypothetical protein